MTTHPLVIELQKLSESSKHAVAQGSSYGLDGFREYLHIEREVEKKLRDQIRHCAKQEKAQLLLVCGNNETLIMTLDWDDNKFRNDWLGIIEAYETKGNQITVLQYGEFNVMQHYTFS